MVALETRDNFRLSDWLKGHYVLVLARASTTHCVRYKGFYYVHCTTASLSLYHVGHLGNQSPRLQMARVIWTVQSGNKLVDVLQISVVAKYRTQGHVTRVLNLGLLELGDDDLSL